MLGPILAAVLAQAGPSTSYQVIQEEGGDLPRRVTVNFVGPGMTCVDTKVSAMNFKTTCTVSATTDCTDDCAFTGTTTVESITASAGISLTAGFIWGGSASTGLVLTSGMTAAQASTTKGAFRLIPDLALGADDLVLDVKDSLSSPLFSVDQEGDGILAGGLSAAGAVTSAGLNTSSTLALTSTGATGLITSATSAATATQLIGALTLRPTATLHADDMVLDVQSAASAHLFSLDLEGDATLAGSLGVGGFVNAATYLGTNTGQITSGVSDVTASTTVGAFQLQPLVTLDANDLVLNVENAAGTNLFTVDQEGDAAVAGLTITGALDIQSTISKSNGTTITVSEHLTSTGDITANGSDFGNGTTAPLVITGGDNDDGSAIGVRINTTNSLTTAGGQIATLENQSAVKAAISRRGAYQFVATDALDTCSETTVGTLARDGISGTDSFSDETHLCFCMGDGDSPVTYFWRNVITGVVGTTTTCTP